MTAILMFGMASLAYLLLHWEDSRKPFTITACGILLLVGAFFV